MVAVDKDGDAFPDTFEGQDSYGIKTNRDCKVEARFSADGSNPTALNGFCEGGQTPTAENGTIQNMKYSATDGENDNNNILRRGNYKFFCTALLIAD